MTLTLFEGPAGSGKTTRLFDAVGQYINAHPFRPDQQVLAITKMHGSRRRMHTKLVAAVGNGKASECVTLNSFALGLVHRWRSLARTIADPIPADGDFAGLATVAARLLDSDAVVRWVAARHPLLVVDELQDLRNSELAVVKGLARGIHVLCAADEFQDLTPQTTCEGVEWARGAGSVVTLNQVHRTNVAAILAAASAVRSGRPLIPGTGFQLLSAANANVAASFIARNLTWAGRSQVAVLSPVGLGPSPFVKDAIARLAEKPFVKEGKSFGPFDITFESSTADELKAWSQLLGIVDQARVVTAAEIESLRTGLPSPLVDWVRARTRLAGEVAFSAVRIREQLARAQSVLRAHGAHRQYLRTGLTVHQAKNREFDRVIILWPVNVGGSIDVKRRLLYNALTRAKHECVIIVQDPQPKKSRLKLAPFA